MCLGPEIAAVASIGSGIAKTAGSLYKGFSGSKAGKLAASVARNNTAILLENAETERLKGDFSIAKGVFEAGRLHTHVERVMGSQRAHFAASNIDGGTGSPLVMAAFTAAQGEVDEGLIRAKAALEKADSNTRAASLTGKAASSAYEEVAQLEKAASSLISGYFGAATEMLSMAGGWKGLSGGGNADATATWDASNPFLLNQPSNI